MDDGRVLELGSGRQAALLAVLLLHRNEVVSMDQLIEDLWGANPPPTALKSVRNAASLLRKQIGACLVTRAPGYLLRVERGELDAERAEALLREARTQPPEQAAELLRSALRLFRGPPLAEVGYEQFAQTEIRRLEELRLACLEERIDADLALGRHAEIVSELETLVHDNPLRERPRGQLMVALYRAGRQADALEAYQEARRALTEGLGIEPSRRLQELERQILNQDEALEAPAPARPDGLLRGRRRHGILIAVGALLLLAAATAAAGLELTGGRGQGLPGIAVNSVGEIDPNTNRIVDQIPVGARPAGIAYADGALWIANLDDGTLSRVDPQGGRVVHTVSIGTAPAAVAGGEGAVWAVGSDGIVRRVDPTFNVVSARIQTVKPGGLLGSFSAVPAAAVGFGGVWTATGGFSSVPRVSRVDTATDNVVATVVTGNTPSGVAIGFGAIWVIDSFDNTVSRIDPSGVVTNTIPVGRRPQAIAVGEGAVWVADSLNGAVARIDPATNSVITTIPVGSSPTGIATGAHAVWVTSSHDGVVSRIDPTKNAVVKQIEVGNSPAGITVARGSVWVTSQAAPPLPDTAIRGGVARFDTVEDPQTDPALYPDRQISYATCAKLLNYPDRSAPAGTQLIPEAARSLPTLSPDGRTYTFTIRKGFAFSPPLKEAVTAETFKHSIERALDPRMHGFAISFAGDVVGATTFASGKARHVSGIVARGDTLTITLTHPAPSFLARIAMPLFCAVPLNTPLDPSGVAAIPSAGPYYIASHVPNQQLVLKRNPNYHGPRPHQLDEIIYTIGVPPLKSVTRVEQGRADYVASRLPDEDDTSLAARYGPTSRAAQRGRQRYFVNPILAIGFLELNTSRPLFVNVRMRQAANYAIDRRALAKQGSLISGPGAFTTTPTDQYLPSTMPGFERTSVYPLDGDLIKARRLAGGAHRHAVLYTCTGALCVQLAQRIKQNLEQIGIAVEVRAFPIDEMVTRTLKKGEPWDIAILDWGADFVDPSSFLDLLSPLTSKRFQSKIEQAARVTGASRYQTYGRLAVELARQAAPWVAYANGTSRDFFSPRIGCQRFQPAYGMDLTALCIRH